MLLLIATFISLFLPSPSEAAPLDQDTHRRILFYESWNSAYLISTYMKSLNVVRFDACEVEEERSCKRVATVPIDKLDLFEGRILNMLSEYRDEVAQQADSSIWYFLSRGAKKSQDVKALNLMIAEIKSQGFSNWLLLKEKAEDPAEFSTPAFAHEVEARLKRVFESIPVDPEKCE